MEFFLLQDLVTANCGLVKFFTSFDDFTTPQYRATSTRTSSTGNARSTLSSRGTAGLVNGSGEGLFAAVAGHLHHPAGVVVGDHGQVGVPEQLVGDVVSVSRTLSRGRKATRPCPGTGVELA